MLPSSFFISDLWTNAALLLSVVKFLTLLSAASHRFVYLFLIKTTNHEAFYIEDDRGDHKVFLCFYSHSCLFVSHPWYDHNMINDHMTISFRSEILLSGCGISPMGDCCCAVFQATHRLLLWMWNHFHPLPPWWVFMSLCGSGAFVSFFVTNSRHFRLQTPSPS